MRMVRPEYYWCVLMPSQSGRICLQRLALRCGYRIGEVCEELGCGERYLNEVFKRDIGLPPKVWMRRERMVVARRMLGGGKPTAEVAEALGFGTVNSFRREFLHFYQVLPGEYRRRRLGEFWRG